MDEYRATFKVHNYGPLVSTHVSTCQLGFFLIRTIQTKLLLNICEAIMETNIKDIPNIIQAHNNKSVYIYIYIYQIRY